MLLSASTTKLVALSLLSLTVVSLTTSSAQAGPNNDVFSAAPAKNSVAIPGPPMPDNPVAASGAMSMQSADTPEKRWFEQFDAVTFSGYPTDSERVTLAMPFNQEEERVQRWTQVASKVAHRYRETAKGLRNIQVPYGRQEIVEYRNQKAEWFDAAASVYEELIKPRKPAQTIEELHEQLNKVSAEAESLSSVKTALLAMDRNLRRTYRVHAPKQTDSLTKYVTGSNPLRK